MSSVARKILPSSVRPTAYLHSLITKASHQRVMTGPFAGLKYAHGAVCGPYLPRLIGCYEKELWPALEEIFLSQFEIIIDIGAAEGYYACGLALRFPESRVLAFEAEEDARRHLAAVAMDNGIQGRMEIRGDCDENGLLECLDSERLTLILCDCEGCEADILSQRVVGSLVNAHVIIETHDGIRPGVHELLKTRFAATHLVVDIPQQSRSMTDWPIDNLLCRILFKRRILRLLQERPPNGTGWLYARPLTQQAS